MQAQIIFTDVDGTLVDDEHHARPEDAAIISAVAQAVPFCLVSARSPEGLYPVQKALGFSGPLVCFSGAYVLDEQGGELSSTVIGIEDAASIKRFLDVALPHICVGTYGFHTWVVNDRGDPRVAREEFFVQASAMECRDIEQVFGRCGIHKFLLMGGPDEILGAEQTIRDRYPNLAVVRSNEMLCEIMAGGVSKADGVSLLCNHYGVLPENAIAFGDGYNDFEMLAAVGRSYAMANAELAVKEAATHRCAWTNAQGGVAKTLAQLFCGAAVQ
ncbi:HAD family phosphatase [Coriobacteriales bacterium OH1046]|nr:HAD family phosphatase [Coriobacteriales bacterium OH1046]